LILGPIQGLAFALMIVLFGGLVGRLLNGFIGGFTHRVKVGKASPNQGIKLSLKNSLVVFLVTSLIFMPIVGLISGLMQPPLFMLLFGLAMGPVIGQFFGLNRGGSAVISTMRYD
jgi:hypothetical protein